MDGAGQPVRARLRGRRQPRPVARDPEGRRRGERPDRVRVLELARNFGQHQAILAAFQNVTGDVVVTLDADLQNPPEEIPKLLAKIDEGYDVVGGVRQNRQDAFLRAARVGSVNRVPRRHHAACA